jgi:hypothetical protein
VERDLPGVPDGLALDRETMRELGYRTVDILVERLHDETVPPLRRATPAEMRTRLSARRRQSRSRSTSCCAV